MGRYNTRESSPATNPVFSRVCGEFNNKIKQLLNLLKQVKSQSEFEEVVKMKDGKHPNPNTIHPIAGYDTSLSEKTDKYFSQSELLTDYPV